MKKINFVFVLVMVLALLFLFMITPTSMAVTPYERQRGTEIAESHQILFDDNFNLLDCIHLDGEEYYIIKQKNGFLLANRLDIYCSDGRSVGNHKLSQLIFEGYAWRQQTDKLKAMDRGDLRGVLTTSGNIGSTTAPLHQVTDTVVSAIDEAKSVKIGNIYVWDTATKIKPELKSFENTVRSFDKEVGEWDSASYSVNTNLPDVIEGLESIDRGEEIDWTGFAYSTKASVGAFNELSVKTGQMSYRVSSVREKLKEVNRGLGSVGGGLLAGAFGELDGKLGSVQDSIDGYTGRLDRYSREFNEISEDVERIERDRGSEWKHSLDEESASKLIYWLLVAISIGIIIVIITGLTDFRRRILTGKGVLFSSVKKGAFMFVGSIGVGILIILTYILDYINSYSEQSIKYTCPAWYNRLINIPCLCSHPVSSYQIFIFLIYVIGLIVIFATIWGILANKDKVDYIEPFWIRNYASFVVMILCATLGDGIVIRIVAPLLLFASITFPIIYLIVRRMGCPINIVAFILVISFIILLIYRTYTKLALLGTESLDTHEGMAVFSLIFGFGLLAFISYLFGVKDGIDSRWI